MLSARCRQAGPDYPAETNEPAERARSLRSGVEESRAGRREGHGQGWVAAGRGRGTLQEDK